MSVLDILKEHEDRLLARIARLETQVKELTSENEKLEEKKENQHKGLIDLLLGRTETPAGLEFHDGIIQRSFQADLHMLVLFTLEERWRGQKSRDDDGRLIPYIPYDGRVHMILDKESGFPNVGDPVTPTLEDAHIYVNKRKVWVNALLVALTKIM
jgi:FtsZ-binding cell division protein ZapB